MGPDAVMPGGHAARRLLVAGEHDAQAKLAGLQLAVAVGVILREVDVLGSCLDRSLLETVNKLENIHDTNGSLCVHNHEIITKKTEAERVRGCKMRGVVIQSFICVFFCITEAAKFKIH